MEDFFCFISVPFSELGVPIIFSEWITSMHNTNVAFDPSRRHLGVCSDYVLFGYNSNFPLS